MIFDLRRGVTPTTSQNNNLSPDARNVIFMGSGVFALPLLEMLHDDPSINIVSIVTKPDRKIGRGHTQQRQTNNNHIKEYAVTHNITLLQPEKLDDSFYEKIPSTGIDLLIVASYGKILPQKLLELFPYGALNVHASLLPKFRGASPIHNAIIMGEKKTGITLIQMDTQLDHGPIIAQSSLPIDSQDTTVTLEEKLAKLAVTLLAQTLPAFFAKEITPTPQNDAEATLCQIIEREDGHILATYTTEEVYNRYRAFIRWPGIFLMWKKDATNILRIKLLAIAPAQHDHAILKKYAPGTIFTEEKRLFLRTQDGAIMIERLQREGGKELSAKDFINGNPTFIGSIIL